MKQKQTANTDNLFGHKTLTRSQKERDNARVTCSCFAILHKSFLFVRAAQTLSISRREFAMAIRLSLFTDELWPVVWADAEKVGFVQATVETVRFPLHCDHIVGAPPEKCECNLCGGVVRVACNFVLFVHTPDAKGLRIVEYPYYGPANLRSASRCLNIVFSHDVIGKHYGAPGSLLSALTFFVDLSQLPMDSKFQINEIGRGDVFKQCSAAALLLKMVLPRGIQLYKFDGIQGTWYFSVVGREQRESMMGGITFSRMRTGMASVAHAEDNFVALAFPSFNGSRNSV